MELHKQKIGIIRQLIPDATITTDLIVGFPGENDNDFNQTLQFLQDIRI